MRFFSSEKAFSLVELLTVIALIGILAAIAIPLYNNYQLRAGRTDATATLLEMAQQAERFFVRNNKYTDAFPENNQSASGKYDIKFEAKDNGLSFTLTATPRGTQDRDKDCREIGINNRGQRTAKDSASQDASNVCWK